MYIRKDFDEIMICRGKYTQIEYYFTPILTEEGLEKVVFIWTSYLRRRTASEATKLWIVLSPSYSVAIRCLTKDADYLEKEFLEVIKDKRYRKFNKEVQYEKLRIL